MRNDEILKNLIQELKDENTIKVLPFELIIMKDFEFYGFT